MADEQFFETLRKRFAAAQQAEQSQRQEMLEDLRFRAGEQWPQDIQQAREQDHRPCLTINRLPATIHQVVNDVRQNRPTPTVSAVDDAGDIETAKVYQGLIRHIERQSHAPAVRSYAADYAISIGRGYYRVVTDYASPTSFDQEIYIRRIKNPFSVYFDPSCQQPDYSDAQWAFVVDNLSRDEYKRRWPDSEMARGGFTSIGDREPIWVSADGVQVAEYFHIGYAERTLALLEDGRTAFADQVADRGLIVQERPTQVPTVKWCKTNGFEKLQETIWAGQWIPIIVVLGEEIDVDGETRLSGMIRDAKDPQRMYNYWASAQTEMIALAPRAPYVAAEGQIEGHEHQWEQANVRNFPVLTYKPKALGDHLVPAPQRQTFEPPVMAISQARMQAADDLKSTTGIYDASLGARSNETSGRAILARQREGDVSNFHYIDAINTAITHETRILVDLIPKIYDRPGRVVRIIGEEGDERTVALNTPTKDRGVDRIYAMDAGKYDVAVSVGPSYTTKRAEAAESMLEFIKVYPQAAQFIGDLLAKNMDWPGAQEIADRLRKLLPPELQKADGEQQIPPAVQAKVQQLNQMVEQLTQALNQASDEIRTRKYELESRERVEAMKVQAQLIKTQVEAGSREGIELLRQEIAAIDQRLSTLGIDEPVTDEPEMEQPAPGQPTAQQPMPEGQ
ncbi:MAG: portal protein [Bryobacteraceae bacterium]